METPELTTELVSDWEAQNQGNDEVAEEQQIDPLLEELRLEFGENGLTEILVEAAYNPVFVEALLQALPVLKEEIQNRSKVTFHTHIEPNGDVYFMKSLMPREFKTQWLNLLTQSTTAYTDYADELLQAVMVWPSFEETAWDHENDKLHRPQYFTKGRLITTYLTTELPDTRDNGPFSFKPEHLDNAVQVATKKRKSL